MDKALPLISLLLSYQISCAYSQEFTISASSPDLEPGGMISISCTAVSPTDVIVWERQTGDVTIQLASGQTIEDNFHARDRYMLSASTGPQGVITELLTIHSAQYEDFAKIGCRSISTSSQNTNFITIAVCDDPEKEWCLCASKKGWIDPDCFEKPDSIATLESKYTKAVVGLGVCLAIAIIYGFVMTLLVGADCIQRLAAKHKREQELQEARGTVRTGDPYGESEVLHLDPSETGSQASYEGGVRSRMSSMPLPPEPSSTAPMQEKPRVYGRSYKPPERKQDPYHPPPYLSPQTAPTAPPQPTHSNQAYQDDEPDEYQEIGAAAPPLNSRKPNGGPNYSNSPHRGYPEDGSYSAGGTPHGRTPTERTPQGRTPQERMPYDRAPRGYDGYQNTPPVDQVPYGGKAANPSVSSFPYDDNKSPGAWSTKSSKVPYSQPDSGGYNQRNAYSERPPRDQHANRAGHSEPRRLEFEGPSSYNKQPYEHMNGLHSYDDRSRNHHDRGGAYVDKTDTVV